MKPENTAEDIADIASLGGFAPAATFVTGSPTFIGVHDHV
jgi:hypothetical protein